MDWLYPLSGFVVGALVGFYTDGASQTDEGTALATVWLWPRIEASYL